MIQLRNVEKSYDVGGGKLFVLRRIQEVRAPRRGDVGMLVAFGPGLTFDGILMRW